MNYSIQKTSSRGQVILRSNETRNNAGICPIVSLQMPEIRAQQIVRALEFIQLMAVEGKASHVPDRYQRTAISIAEMPIEMK